MDGEADMLMYAWISTIEFTHQFKKSLEDNERMNKWISTSADRWMNI